LKAVGVATDGAGLLDFFHKHTRRGAGRAQVQTLISQLGDDSFERREQASLHLVEIGELALDQLRQAQRDKDPEVANRARECLEKIKTGKGSTSLLFSAAARLLAVRKPAGTVEALLGYLPNADEGVAGEIHKTFASLALVNGKPEPLLRAALADAEPSRRVASALAFLYADVEETRPAVRKLLQDSELSVRLAIAL